MCRSANFLEMRLGERRENWRRMIKRGVQSRFKPTEPTGGLVQSISQRNFSRSGRPPRSRSHHVPSSFSVPRTLKPRGNFFSCPNDCFDSLLVEFSSTPVLGEIASPMCGAQNADVLFRYIQRVLEALKHNISIVIRTLAS